MKCVCGYKYYFDTETGKTVGDKDFIMLEEVNAKRSVTNGYGYEYLSNATIYACPKCGTLKLNL